MGKVVAVCGMPGSGKGEFAAILASQHIPILSMGDMVRREVNLRGLEESPTIFGEVAHDLRQTFGKNVLAVRLVAAVNDLMASNEIVLIEGMRGTDEYNVFAEQWGQHFVSVAIEANEDIRYERIQSRGRSEDGSREEFEQRNAREIGWGLNTLLQTAHVTLQNNGTLDQFSNDVSAWLDSFRASIEH
jgi:dephospho-CoA kinase